MNIYIIILIILPIAVTIFSIALESIFRRPLLVAAIIFAAFLLVSAFVTALPTAYLVIATFVYAILAFVVAWLYEFIRYLIRRFRRNNNNNNCNSNNNNAPRQQLSNTRK